MTDKERAKLYSDSFNAAIADRDRLKAEVERLTAEVERLKVPMSVTEQDYRALMGVNKGLLDIAQSITADRDRLRVAIKALDADLVRLIDEHTPAITPVDHGLCSALAYVRPKLAAIADGDGEGEGGQG